MPVPVCSRTTRYRNLFLAGFLMQVLPTMVEAQTPVWELVGEFRFIGSDSLPLSYIETLIEGPGGAVYVVGRGDASIHVLGSTGRYQGTVGREGDGPGEFRVPPRIGIAEGILWALDRISGRITRFSPAGDFLDAERIPSVLSTEGLSMVPIGVLKGGKGVFLESASSSEISGAQRSEVRVASLDPRGSTESDGTLSLDKSTLDLRFSLPNGMSVGTFQPWSTSDLLALSPRGDGFVIVRSRGADGEIGRYELEWFDAGGTTVRSRFVDFRAAPLEDEAIDSFLHGTSEGFAARFGLSVRSVRRTIESELYTPEYLPGVAATRRGWSGGGLLVATDGTTWVRQQDAEGVRWIVFDQTGATVAHLLAPDDLVLQHVDGEGVWGVREDQFGTPIVYRYMIARGARDR